MTTDPNRPGSITFVLVGLVLLMALIGIGFGCFPLVECPCCRGRDFHAIQHLLSFDELIRCKACRGGKVTPLRRWVLGVEIEQGESLSPGCIFDGRVIRSPEKK